MTATQTLQRSRLLAWLAGAMDFGTGLGMVFAPALTLGLMQVTVPGAEAWFSDRFVGVFVGAVGFTYLWSVGTGRAADLRAVFGFTVPFRLVAGLFCAVGVGWEALSPMWLSVTVADWGLVGLQLWLLRCGAWEDTV